MSDQDVVDELKQVLVHKREQSTRWREQLAEMDDPANRMITESEIEGLERTIERIEYHIEVMGGDPDGT